MGKVTKSDYQRKAKSNDPSLVKWAERTIAQLRRTLDRFDKPHVSHLAKVFHVPEVGDINIWGNEVADEIERVIMGDKNGIERVIESMECPKEPTKKKSN